MFQIRFDGNADASTGTAKPAAFWKTDGSFVVGIANFESAKSFSTPIFFGRIPVHDDDDNDANDDDHEEEEQRFLFFFV